MKICSTSRLSTAPLLLLTAGLCSLPLQQAMAVDGIWIGTNTNTAPGANWSTATNWLGGVIPGGADSTATLIYNPISDNGTITPSTLAGATIFDGPLTLGHLALADLDGVNGATLGLNNPSTGVQTLTLDTTNGLPTLSSGLLLSSQFGSGKRAIINSIFAGNDGIRFIGQGAFSLRGNGNTLSGAFAAEGGSVEIRQAFSSVTAVTVNNGASLDLNYTGSLLTNHFAAATPLTLGGAGGSGVLLNSNKANTTTSTQNYSQTFGSVSLGGGANEIRATSIANTGTGGVGFQNMTYNLGTVTTVPHATLNFQRNVGGASTAVINLSNSNNSSGIIGAWATHNGTDWASSSAGAAAAYTGYTADVWSAGNNTNSTKNQNLTSATTGTLRLNNGANIANILTLTGTNVISTGGLINGAQANLITGGTLTTGDSNGDLFIHGNATGGTGLRIDSLIADNGSTPLHLIKSLGGALTLGADNTYTGTTIVGQGSLILGNKSGGSATGSVAGDILLSSGSTASAQYNPNGALAFNRSGTYTVTNSINPTTQGGGFIEQWSQGTLVFNKAMNVSGLRTYSGMTRLDFSAAGAPVSEIFNGTTTAGIANMQNGRLLLRSGGIEIVGKADTNNLQSFGLTEVGGLSKLTLSTSGTGTATLDLGSIRRFTNDANGGGVLALTTPANTFVKGFTASYSANLNAVIADAGVPFVIINGDDWGARDGTVNGIVAGSTLSGFYTATPGTGLTGGKNTDVTTSDSITGTITDTSLRFNTAGANTLTVNAAGSYRPGSILVTAAVGANTTTIAGAGDLRAAATGNRDLNLIQNNAAGKLVISTPIVNFDATNTTTLVKHGAGEVELTGTSTFTGRTLVNEGTLRLSGTAALGNATTRANSLLQRGGEVILQDSAAYFASAFTSIGQRIGESATLTLKDSAVFNQAGSSDFNVGDVNAVGIVNISGSAQLLTPRLFVGKSGNAEGTLNQTGGSITLVNTGTSDWTIGGNAASDTAAVGTYNMSGGTLNPGGVAFMTGRNGTGTFNISGTAAIAATGWQVIGRYHSGTGTVNISSGSYNGNSGGSGQNFFIVGEEGTGTLNISGTGTVTAKNLSLAHNGGQGTVVQTGGTVDLQSTTAIGTINAGVVYGQTNTPARTVTDYRGTYTLSGGLLKTNGIRENPGLVTPVSSRFNFDGGTVQAIANNATFMDNLDTAAVQAGGAKIDTSTFNITIAQALVHEPALGATVDGGLTKQSGGTLTLTGASTYTGPTNVNAGTLLVNGNNGAATGPITVASGATLGGSGTFGGALNVAAGGIFAPGTSPNTLTTTSSASFAPTSVLNYEFNGGDQTVGGGINDLFTGITMLTLDGTLNIAETVAGSFSTVTSGSWRVMNYSGALTDNILVIGTKPTLASGYDLIVDSSTPGQINVIVAPIPEPATVGLLSGLLAWAGFRRRRIAA